MESETTCKFPEELPVVNHNNYSRHFLDDDWIIANKKDVVTRSDGPQANPTFDPAVLVYDPTKLAGEWTQDPETKKWSHSGVEFDTFK